MLVFLFLTITLYFLIAAVITQIFNPNAELVIPIGIPTTKSRNLNIYSNCRTQNKKVLNIIQNCTNLFVFFTNQFI